MHNNAFLKTMNDKSPLTIKMEAKPKPDNNFFVQLDIFLQTKKFKYRRICVARKNKDETALVQ